MRNNCKLKSKNNLTFKKTLLLSGVAFILSTFSVQAMEEENDDSRISGIGTFAKLPKELVIGILGYLHPRDLATVALASPQLKEISEDNAVWDRIAQGYIGSPEKITQEAKEIRLDSIPKEVEEDISKKSGKSSLIDYDPKAPIKSQLKVLSSYFQREKNQIVTISQLQFFKGGFRLGRRKFQVINYQVLNDDLEYLSPSENVKFEWETDLNYIDLTTQNSHKREGWSASVYVDSSYSNKEPLSIDLPEHTALLGVQNSFSIFQDRLEDK